MQTDSTTTSRQHSEDGHDRLYAKTVGKSAAKEQREYRRRVRQRQLSGDDPGAQGGSRALLKDSSGRGNHKSQHHTQA
jgi:hypothetical protein